MSLLFLLGIVALAIVRHWRIPNRWVEYPVNLDALFIGFYVLWILVERPIAKWDVSTEGKTTTDFATCRIYAFGQAFTFLSALWFHSVLHVPNVAHFIGIGLFLFGVCYRLWAIRTLGLFYSHRVRTVIQQGVGLTNHSSGHAPPSGLAGANNKADFFVRQLSKKFLKNLSLNHGSILTRELRKSAIEILVKIQREAEYLLRLPQAEQSPSTFRKDRDKQRILYCSSKNTTFTSFICAKCSCRAREENG
jgi:hypothetical protein